MSKSSEICISFSILHSSLSGFHGLFGPVKEYLANVVTRNTVTSFLIKYTEAPDDYFKYCGKYLTRKYFERNVSVEVNVLRCIYSSRFITGHLFVLII